MRRIYLDSNATTALDPRVAEVMQRNLAETVGNPSSIHAFGRAARRRIEDARRQMAALLGAEPTELVFSSGATEAANLAVYGLAARAGEGRRRILLSPIEHAAILEPVEKLERFGFERVFMPVDACGRVEIEAAAELLGPEVAFSCLMWANNETGVIQPVEDWARRCAAAGLPLVCDAAQAVGRMPVDFGAIGCDVLIFSAHKMHGPTGAGGLLIRPGTPFENWLVGGGQERERRAGTENELAILGMAEALSLAVEEMDERRARIEELADRLLERISSQAPAIELNAAAAPRWPGTLNLRVPGLMGELLLMKLDLAGFAVSLGAACSSGAIEPSHVLAAMGLDIADNLASIRVSLSWRNEVDEIDRFTDALTALQGET